jgi:hypothetical protein
MHKYININASTFENKGSCSGACLVLGRDSGQLAAGRARRPPAAVAPLAAVPPASLQLAAPARRRRRVAWILHDCADYMHEMRIQEKQLGQQNRERASRYAAT